jgi:small subunit ribosomal protein S16
MLAIRFQRTGRKNDPSFRIIVSEKARSPKAGNPLEVVGSYNPKTKHTIIDDAAVKGWLAKGAKASGTVHNLLVTKGVITGKKVNVLQKRSIKKEGEETKAAEPVVAAAEAPKAEVPAEASAQ